MAFDFSTFTLRHFVPIFVFKYHHLWPDSSNFCLHFLKPLLSSATCCSFLILYLLLSSLKCCFTDNGFSTKFSSSYSSVSPSTSSCLQKSFLWTPAGQQFLFSQLVVIISCPFGITMIFFSISTQQYYFIEDVDTIVFQEDIKSFLVSGLVNDYICP